jgi:hypothetical protein
MRYLLLSALLLLTACTGADGVEYTVVPVNAIEKARYDAAFLMCIELTARTVGAVVPPSPENAVSVLTYCANEVVNVYGATPQPEPQNGSEL